MSESYREMISQNRKITVRLGVEFFELSVFDGKEVVWMIHL